MCRLWLALIDDIASEMQIPEAWPIALSMQAVQANSAQEHYQSWVSGWVEEGRNHAKKDQRWRCIEQDIACRLATMNADRLH